VQSETCQYANLSSTVQRDQVPDYFEQKSQRYQFGKCRRDGWISHQGVCEMNPFKNKGFVVTKETDIDLPIQEIVHPVKNSIKNQVTSGPAWRRPPDPACNRCKGVGMIGEVVCHCVTKKEYTPRNSTQMTITE
jgi:hypothetical protein